MIDVPPPRLVARGLVPVYPVPRAQVGDRIMLYHPNGGGVSIRDATSFEEIARHPLSDTQSPRLHPDGWLYYCQRDRLYREPTDGGRVSARRAIRTLPGRPSIGGNEGDFDGNFRWLPIRTDPGMAGLLDVSTANYIEAPAVHHPIDFVHTSRGGRTLVIGIPDVGIFAAWRRPGRALNAWQSIAPAVGHSAPAQIQGRPYLVTTTSKWERDIPRGGGSQEWLVAVPVRGGEPIPICMLNDGPEWRYAIHVSCWRRWACVSFYGARNAPIWIVRIREDAPPHEIATVKSPIGDYWTQPHAAWSDNGRRIFYADAGDTYLVRVAAITRRKK